MSRLVRSHLVERASADRLVEVVRHVCGIHAQVMGSTELQLVARVDGITQADVREALWERRELVKMWTLRWTLHIHAADEIRLWTAARRAVVGAADHANDGLENVDEIVAAIGDALRGRQLTREELADAVVGRVKTAPRERLASGWGYYLGDAAIAGQLCFGPPQGQKVTFVHPDDWLGRGRPTWEPEVAVREVARRYAAAYGPVTHREFRQWLGSRERSFVDLDFPKPKDAAATSQSVRLLPEYDVYVMGYRDRDAFVPPAVREQIKAHGKGRYEGPAGTPFLLVDGVCAGIWRRRRTAKRIELAVEPARTLTRAERAGVDAEADRIGAFLGLEPALTIV
jgi:winged helix DNA-binding protein